MEGDFSSETLLTGKNISFLELSVERAGEIKKLTDAIENPNRTKMAYQRLPRHMQRRAMSHDPKRLPVRLRQMFLQQRDLSQLKATKRPSRRHRRRPSHLLQEYNRRQRQHVWLETHIWHARRFHMVRRWGYQLPERATDKGFRAAYRATVHHCLIQDVSYLCQLELRGPQSTLLAGLRRLGGGAAGSARLLSGRHQGRLLLLSAEEPRWPLAPAGLLWQPPPPPGPDPGSGSGSEPCRRLWLWVHPAAYEAVRAALVRVFDLEDQPREEAVKVAPLTAEPGPDPEDPGEPGEDPEVPRESKEDQGDPEEPRGDQGEPEQDSEDAMEVAAGAGGPQEPAEDAEGAAEQAEASEAAGKSAARPCCGGVDQLKLAPRRLDVIRRHVGRSSAVTLTELRDRLVRLRLTGPGSQAVLHACLRVAAAAPAWESAAGVERQRRLWARLGLAQSPGELPAGCVVALTADDPRLHMPQRRQLAALRQDDLMDEPIAELPGGAEDSPLWDESTRRRVTNGKVSDCEVNRARSQLLVPTATPQAVRLAPVPVLLMQNDRPPGWDLLLPAGYGMTFWVALQYHGARAGGLREADRIALETGVPRFPAEFPDSEAGRLWDAEERARLRMEYFK